MKSVQYSLLTSVEINHEYFPNGVFRDLKVVPDQKTQIFMWNAGLLFQPVESGFEVYHTDSFTADYVKELTDFLGDYYLRFNLFTSDQNFIYFTETALDQLTLHCFSNKNLAGADGSDMLATLQANIGMNGSLGYVDLHLDEFRSGSSLDAKDYQINFTARDAQWNYYLWNTETEASDSLIIEDAQGNAFEGPVKEQMPDGSTAIRYSSGTQCYPLRQKPEAYCKLKKVSQQGSSQVEEDVLVEQLPAASPASITSIANIPPDDREVACSSIYVYL